MGAYRGTTRLALEHVPEDLVAWGTWCLSLCELGINSLSERLRGRVLPSGLLLGVRPVSVGYGVALEWSSCSLLLGLGLGPGAGTLEISVPATGSWRFCWSELAGAVSAACGPSVGPDGSGLVLVIGGSDSYVDVPWKVDVSALGRGPVWEVGDTMLLFMVIFVVGGLWYTAIGIEAEGDSRSWRFIRTSLGVGSCIWPEWVNFVLSGPGHKMIQW